MDSIGGWGWKCLFVWAYVVREYLKIAISGHAFAWGIWLEVGKTREIRETDSTRRIMVK